MSRLDRITSRIIETQKRIARLAERDYGITLKRISVESGIPYPTVRSYFSQARNAALSELPLSAFVKLCGIIPDELLSQLLADADRHLMLDEEDEDSEFDDLADVGDNLARLVRQARHPNSPGGTEIVAVEEEAINRARRQFGRKAKLRIVA